MITISTDTEYREALKEMDKIFQTNPLEGTVEWNYYYHLLDAIQEWEHINYPMK